ncbi:MAG: YraN family protein [Phycisphaerae bacterium]
MSLFRRDLGRTGEDAACKLLRSRGYCVLERNFTCSLGEIDIICSNKGTVVFVEVKTRSSDSGADPEANVTRVKQRKIENIARIWLELHPDTDAALRFDVVSVVKPSAGPPRVRHMIDAFGPTRDF